FRRPVDGLPDRLAGSSTAGRPRSGEVGAVDADGAGTGRDGGGAGGVVAWGTGRAGADGADSAALLLRSALRSGLVRVISAGEKDSTSLDPVGLTWMKSPSLGSPSAVTLPE